jgi:hypothetical protein
MSIRTLAFVLAVFLAFCTAANAQNVTGQISGRVTDPQNAVIGGATVHLTNNLTQQVREFFSDETGAYVFLSLVPGDYHLTVEIPGFKTYQQNDIHVSAQERLNLKDIKLEIAELTSDTVTVESELSRVQTTTADRIETLTQSTIEGIPMPSRSFLAATRVIAGSQSTSAAGGGSINGGQTGQLVLQLDGIIQQDSGAPSASANVGRFNVDPDAINEVQVQVNSLNAEFGSRAGGQVLVTTKSGTNQFHGSLSEHLRNEALDSNSFFNNKNGIKKPQYRFHNFGGTIGGPVLLPFTSFNNGRNKLFFFYAEEHQINHGANTNSFTMPTAAEAAGDFSQTTDSKGVLIPIIDPETGKQFPNNIIPANRISPVGLAMMRLLPSVGPVTTAFGTYQGLASAGGLTAPLVIDPSGLRAYNTLSTFPVDAPQTTRTLRIDFNFGPKTNMYVRLLQSLQNSIGVGSGQTLGGTAWGEFVNTNPQPGRGYVVGLVHTFRPNLITEFTIGQNYLHQQNQPNDAKAFASIATLPNFKDASGKTVNLNQVFNGNFQNLIPAITFGRAKTQSAGNAVTGTTAATFGFDNRWPFDGTESTSNLSDNVTWVKGTHQFKAGFNWEWGARNVSVYSVYNTQGTYYFGSDLGNPYDTGYPFSNLLLGTVEGYGQDNVKQINHARWNQYEWFVQDSWRATRRLTVNYGMRFQIIPQIESQGATIGFFNPASYNAAKAGQLLYPGCKVAVAATGSCSVANTYAVNPITGKQYSGAFVGLFDPSSYSGTPYSGIDLYPEGKFFNTEHPQLGPRVGLAWDIFGDGKTALRASFGIFYQRAYSVDTIASNGSGVGPMKVPPIFQAPLFLNTTLDQLSSATAFFGPQAFNAGDRRMKNPTTNNWSLSIQHDIGKGMVLDVGYVGNNFHHGQGLLQNLNPIAPGTVWSPVQSGVNSIGLPLGTINPQFVNPNQPSQILPLDLVRAKIGYAGIGEVTKFTAIGESYYNALQVQLNKRFGSRVTFTGNYTWQKTISYNNHNQYVDDKYIKDVLNRKQVVNVSTTYNVPSVTRFLGNNAFTKTVMDGWRVDSVVQLFSGNPLAITCTVQNAPAGYPNGQAGVANATPLRCDKVGDLFLPSGTTPAAAGYPTTTDPRLWYPLNAGGALSSHPAFTLPALNSYGFGSGGSTQFWGPKYKNVDLAISKAFAPAKEGYSAELRFDLINAFNWMNPSDPNTTLNYNYSTGAQTNSNFGQITSQTGLPATGQQRVIVASLRFRF